MKAGFNIKLIRHAQSAAQVGGLSSDPGETLLTDLGTQAATEIAQQLSKPDLVVVSPFLRTRQTAEPLLRRFPDIRIEMWPVQEFTYLAAARCRGMNAQLRKPLVDEYWSRNDPRHIDGDGAESFADFCVRVSVFIQRCRSIEGSALIYSHCMFMQAVRMISTQQSSILDMQEFRTACLRSPVKNLEVLELNLN